VAKPRDPALATKLVEAGRRAEWTGGEALGGHLVNPPVWHASTVLYDSVVDMRVRRGGDPHQLYYGRRGTPTQWALAEALTELEPGAAGTLLYPSGVAAIAGTLLALLKPGDRLLMVDSAYEPTRHLCDGLLKRIGIETVYYDPLIGAGIEALLTPETRVVFMESPGSLTFEVQDVPAICEIARLHGVVSVIDNSWATSLLFPAIERGCDASIVACTKYIVGHADAMLGSVTARAGLFERLQRTYWQLGQCAAPDDCYLALRGLRTLGVRLKQHEAGGLAVARWLSERPEIGTVLHPAFEGCPGYDIWKRDFLGSSGLFGFTLKDADDAERVRLIDALQGFGLGFSWGGFESLAIPADPVRVARKWEADGLLIRLHIGLEDPDDLIADLEQGFSGIG